MTHFQPRPSQIKENRHNKANNITRLKPRPSHTVYNIGLFKPRLRDKTSMCFLETRASVDSEVLQRCMDLVFPFRVDVYFVSRTVFLIQFTEPCVWRDIIMHIQEVIEELT